MPEKNISALNIPPVPVPVPVREGEVFITLADSKVSEQVEFAVDNWPDTSGIIAIIATSLTTSGFISSIWSCHKIRTVLPLLLHQTLSISALTPQPTQPFIYNQAPESQNPTVIIDEHVTFCMNVFSVLGFACVSVSFWRRV